MPSPFDAGRRMHAVPIGQDTDERPLLAPLRGDCEELTAGRRVIAVPIGEDTDGKPLLGWTKNDDFSAGKRVIAYPIGQDTDGRPLLGATKEDCVQIICPCDCSPPYTHATPETVGLRARVSTPITSTAGWFSDPANLIAWDVSCQPWLAWICGIHATVAGAPANSSDCIDVTLTRCCPLQPGDRICNQNPIGCRSWRNWAQIGTYTVAVNGTSAFLCVPNVTPNCGYLDIPPSIPFQVWRESAIETRCANGAVPAFTRVTVGYFVFNVPGPSNPEPGQVWWALAFRYREFSNQYYWKPVVQGPVGATSCSYPWSDFYPTYFQNPVTIAKFIWAQGLYGYDWFPNGIPIGNQGVYVTDLKLGLDANGTIWNGKQINNYIPNLHICETAYTFYQQGCTVVEPP